MSSCRIKDVNPQFLKAAAKDKNIGAIAGSSRFLVRKVLSLLPERELELVLEYGPGDGAMTKALLTRLSPTGRLIAIEPNATFVQTLAQIPDPRLTTIHGRAQEVEELLSRAGVTQPADLIISSVPFSFFTPQDRQRLMASSHRLLQPAGELIFFHQYIPLVYPLMRRFFPHTNAHFVLRNLFPCFIVRGRK